MSDFDIAQFKDLFIDESQQYLQALNTCLLALEHSPGDADALDTMFRAAHSLKGGSATMGYDSLAQLAHGAEDLLHHLRSGEWSLTPSLTSLLFTAIDALQSLLVDIAADRQASVDVPALLKQLRSYTPAEGAAAALALAPAAPVAEKLEVEEIGRTPMIRVDVRHLDTLLDIVTEMVIHRSLLVRLGQRFKLTTLTEALGMHNRLLAQLRDAVLEMRMVPVGQVFDRFPRMVRDLLGAQGKEAQLVIEGAEVEMDRTALDALNEPLLHLLRNAVDHGLEPPAERLQAGKTPHGTLHLSAWREQEVVVIEVSDDGRGMDPRQIASVAVERGLASTEAVAEMGEKEVLALICHPGFTLSKEVTAVSGRGVGMNVVKRQIDRLRGTLEIMTIPGQGTTFRLQLPITLSLMPAVLVRVGSERYALPVAAVEQIVKLEPRQIERVGNQEVLSVDGRILPLRRLGTLLDVPDAAPDPSYALLMRHNDQPVGLGVDAVEGHEEIVVKPLPEALRGLPGLSGVTILGEGQTVLILDESL